MKRLKIIGIVFGALALVFALAVGLAFNSGVQTWAVRKAVAGQPGMTVEISRVSAGFSAADISDLRYVKDGVVVTAKAISARYSAWDYLTKKRINVDSVSVQDLLVDLRAATPAASTTTASNLAPNSTAGTPPSNSPTGTTGAAEKSQPFEGVLKQAQLPFDVRVASLTAKGRALLSADQTVAFELTGSGIENGQSGKLGWTIDFTDVKSGASLQTLRATGTATLHLTNDRRIDSVAIDSTAALTGPTLPTEQIKVVAKADQATAGGNEVYAANVSLVRGTSVETVLKTDAQYIASAHEIAGAWEIAIRSEQLAALLSGLGLPEVAASGAGKFNLKPASGAVSASGDLQGRVSQLQKLSPALESIGSVQFKTTFDGGVGDNLVRLEKLSLEVTGADGKKFAQVNSLQKITYSLTDKRVGLADPKAEVARITLQQLPLAWAQSAVKPMIIESGDLSLVLAVEAEPDGSRIRTRSVEPLTIRAFSLRSGDKKLADQISFSVRPNVDYSATRIVAQLAELNVSMPAGDALTGNLSAEVTNLSTTPAIAFSGQVQAKIIAALKPYLSVDTGPLALSTNFEGRQEGQTVNLAKLSATVSRQNGGLLTVLELQQAVRIDAKAMTFVVANPTATAARVRLGEIPLAWAEGFVPKSKFAGGLTGGVVEIAMRSADDLTITTMEPLTLRGVSATLDGKPQVQNLDLTANLTATKRGDNVSYDVRRIDVKQGEATLAVLVVAGETKLGAPAAPLRLTAKGNLDADVAALMKQPALAEYATLSQGRVTGVFEANIADTITAIAVVSAKNLTAKQDNRVLGDFQLNLNANVKPDGSGTLTLPITLTNATRKSDVAITGVFGRSADKKNFLFTGKVASEQLVVDDFQPLAGVAPGGEKPKPAASPAPGPRSPAPTAPAASKPTRDTQPFWAGVNGKVELDLKRVLYGKDYTINAIRGTAVITDSRLSVDGLQGNFKENPFKVAAVVTFNAAQPKPYAMTGSADVANFDVGEFLRAANPGEKAAIETKATISAKLNGNGGTVDDLAKNAFGKFELTGTQGTMRLLARKGGASTAVNLLSLGLAIAGARNESEGASAAAEIARLLNEVPFDNVKMQVERGADLSFKLTSLELVSPMLRMTGAGIVTSKSMDDLQNAPMNITLQLGAKDQLGYLFNRVGMLGDTKDEKGYQLLTRTFTVGGTPSKPDSSALWKLLAEAAIGRLR